MCLVLSYQAISFDLYFLFCSILIFIFFTKLSILSNNPSSLFFLHYLSIPSHLFFPPSFHPPAEPKTAVSILISAEFLKMTPLVEEVLQYVHDNVNLILEAQVNLTCLSDAILSR